MPAHPLYKELQSLQKHIDALRGVAHLDIAEQVGRGWESPVIVGPVLTDYPTWRLTQWRDAWWQELSPVEPGPLARLPMDLEARLAWHRRQIRQQTQAQLRQAEAEDNRRLAQLRIDAAQRYQTELSNLGLDLSLSNAEAEEQAAQRKQAIGQEIEQQLAAEARQSQARLGQLRERLGQEEERAVAQARQQLLAGSQERGRQLQASVEDVQEQLRQRLAEIGQPQWLPGQPASRPGPLAIDQAEATRRREEAFAEYRALRTQQVARLVARKAALTAAVAAGTRQAARWTAWEENIDLHVLPDEARQGDDATDIIDQRLRLIWPKH